MVTGSPTGSWPASHLGLATSPGPEQAPDTATNACVPSVKMNPARQLTPPMLTLTPGCTVALAAGAQRGVVAAVSPGPAAAGPPAIMAAGPRAAAVANSRTVARMPGSFR